MHQSISTIKKKNYLLYFVAFISFVLWDFYFGDYKSGYRIIELMVAPILVTYLFIRKLQNKTVENFFIPNYILTFVFCGITFNWVILGLLNDSANIKPILGIVLGVTLYFLLIYSNDFKTKTLKLLLERVILVVSSCLILQWFLYVFFDYFINFHIFLTESPRVFSSIFRPSGLFLEPGNHSVTMLMLLLAYWKDNFSFNIISSMGIISILLSLSLFGYLGLICVLLYFFRSKLIYILQGILVLPLLIFLILNILDSDNIVFISERVVGWRNDSSFVSRFSGIFNYDQFNGLDLLFGRGISNAYLDYGNNGYAFLISAGGLLGLFVFLLFFVSQSMQGNRTYILFSLCLILIASPIFTTMFFWFWLALMTNSNIK